MDEEYDDFEQSGADYCRRCGGECEGDHDPDDEGDDRSDFADPGGESALRAETRSNPRNLPCPSCHAPNTLTPKDKALGYQCDGCANAAERGVDRDLRCGGPGKCELCGTSEDGEEEPTPAPAIWDGKSSAGGTYERGE